MQEPIYFSKIMYVERLIYRKPRSVITLDLIQKELVYEGLFWKPNMPVIQGTREEEWLSRIQQRPFSASAKFIRSGKTNFEPVLIQDENYEKEIVFQYGVKLDQQQIKALLPYCNALDFEPYRHREMSMNDEGYIGYRDEVHITFHAITDSYIPYLELPMNYYYDEDHIWPSEKLYRYLVKKYLSDKKLKEWRISYGGLSLFI